MFFAVARLSPAIPLPEAAGMPVAPVQEDTRRVCLLFHFTHCPRGWHTPFPPKIPLSNLTIGDLNC